MLACKALAALLSSIHVPPPCENTGSLCFHTKAPSCRRGTDVVLRPFRDFAHKRDQARHCSKGKLLKQSLTPGLPNSWGCPERLPAHGLALPASEDSAAPFATAAGAPSSEPRGLCEAASNRLSNSARLAFYSLHRRGSRKNRCRMSEGIATVLVLIHDFAQTHLWDFGDLRQTGGIRNKFGKLNSGPFACPRFQESKSCWQPSLFQASGKPHPQTPRRWAH